MRDSKRHWTILCTQVPFDFVDILQRAFRADFNQANGVKFSRIAQENLLSSQQRDLAFEKNETRPKNQSIQRNSANDFLLLNPYNAGLMSTPSYAGAGPSSTDYKARESGGPGQYQGYEGSSLGLREFGREKSGTADFEHAKGKGNSLPQDYKSQNPHNLNSSRDFPLKGREKSRNVGANGNKRSIQLHSERNQENPFGSLKPIGKTTKGEQLFKGANGELYRMSLVAASDSPGVSTIPDPNQIVRRHQDLSSHYSPFKRDLGHSLIQNENQKTPNYKPHTLKEYKEKVRNEKYNYGGLGPNTNTEEWNERRRKQIKINAFSSVIREVNAQKIANGPGIPKEKPVHLSTREKGLEFAKSIPRPKAQFSSGKSTASSNNEILSELDLMEQKHAYFLQRLNNV